jgi:uncharacterized delta-60 repeat protein
MKTFFITLVLLMIVFIVKSQSGANDPSFNPTDLGDGIGDGFDNRVFTLTIQSDEKILCGGGFTEHNGISCVHIARLYANGSIDTSFNTGTGFNEYVFAFAIQPDEKIIVGGNFTEYDGHSASKLIRLNTDGTIDNSFNIGTGFNDRINAIVLQSDGKIIAAGSFSNYNGVICNRIVRLNTDGTIDNSYIIGTGFNQVIYDLAIQSDEKILVGGEFTNYNGTACNRIVRLNTDGSIDNSFEIGTGFNSSVLSIVQQTDGKIIAGGEFGSYNDTNYMRLVRLNPDGSIDNTMNIGAGFNSTVYSIAIQSDGKVIVGGEFLEYNGVDSRHIARISSDGSLDNSFDIGSGFFFSILSGFVNSVAVQTDGKIIVGGDFNDYDSNVCNNIARLKSDAVLDTTFNIGSGLNRDVYSLIVQPDEKILVGGYFSSYNNILNNRLLRLNIDGSIDDGFIIGTGFNNSVLCMEINTEGRIFVGGVFESFNNTPINRLICLNSDGSINSSFYTGSGFNTGVYDISIQVDEKIVCGGSFVSYNDTSRNRIIRLNTDGSIDNSFEIGTGFNGFVYAIIQQTDGKILVAGSFNSYNDTTRNRIIRLNPNGTIDADFDIGTGFNGYVNCLSIQEDGKIIAGGYFTSFNGTSCNRITRLNADGSIDNSFIVGIGFNHQVNDIAIQEDGKIIVGGEFTSYNYYSMNHIIRLNTDGSIDGSFEIGTGFNSTNSNQTMSYVKALAIQTDEKILVGGDFVSYNAIGRNRIARLINCGTLIIPEIQIVISEGTNPLCSNDSASFIAITNDHGSNPSYQWKINSLNVGTDSNTFTSSSFNDGDVLTCELTVSELCVNENTVVSNSISISVNPIPTTPTITLSDNVLTSSAPTGNQWYDQNGLINSATDQDYTVTNDGDYYVIVTLLGCSSNPSNTINVSVTNIAIDKDNKPIEVYPNPVLNELVIEIEGNTDKMNFKILNAIGQVIFKGNFVDRTTIQTSSFLPGVYLIKFENGKTFEFKKIIKK